MHVHVLKKVGEGREGRREGGMGEKGGGRDGSRRRMGEEGGC